MTNSQFEIISVKGFDDKYQVNILGKKVCNEYLKEWVMNSDVKLLTLDGTLGGRNGSEFDYLSTDDVHDDWHIGKKYDMQGWFRFPITICLAWDDVESLADRHLRICHGGNNDSHNGYLVVSKRKLREDFKTLRRAKTENLERVAHQMVKKYFEEFNTIAKRMVYGIEFIHYTEDGTIIERIDDVCVDLLRHSYKYVMDNVVINLPLIDREFDAILYRIFTQLSNMTETMYNKRIWKRLNSK